MGDAKCERCKRSSLADDTPTCWYAHQLRNGRSWCDSDEDECKAVAEARAPLDAEIARLTAEVATLRGQLADAVARSSVTDAERRALDALVEWREAETEWVTDPSNRAKASRADKAQMELSEAADALRKERGR